MYSVGEEGQELCLMSFKFCYMEYNTKEKKNDTVLLYCNSWKKKKKGKKGESRDSIPPKSWNYYFFFFLFIIFLGSFIFWKV